MSSSEIAANITANATFTVGIIASLSVMMFSWVLPKIFEYTNNRQPNILKELIEIRKSLPDGHEDIAKFDEIIAYRRIRYLRKQVELFKGLQEEDLLESLQLSLKGFLQLLLRAKIKLKISNEIGISWMALAIGLLTLVAVLCIGISLGNALAPIR